MKFLSSLLSPIAISGGQIALIVVIAIILIVVASSFRLVTQTKKVIVERLGGYYKTWELGFTS